MPHTGTESALKAGSSCRPSGTSIWQPIGYPAAPTHPPHAIGARGPLGDQNTSMEASFDFSVQRSLKYPHVRPQMGNFATTSRLESDPFPPSRSRGVQRDPLGPLSQNRRRISGWELESQIRRHPRAASGALAAPNTGYGGRSRAPCSAPHRLRFASPRRWSTRVRVRQVSYALSSTTR